MLIQKHEPKTNKQTNKQTNNEVMIILLIVIIIIIIIIITVVAYYKNIKVNASGSKYVNVPADNIRS
jgi:flagellar basal body-associated protein FliL